MSPTPRYCRCISRQTTFSCFFQHIRNIPQARLHEKSRASQPERCGSNTNTSWKTTSGVGDSGKNHTTSERLVKYRARRLSSISNALNTSTGAYGIQPRGQAPRHSGCFLCRGSAFWIERFGSGSGLREKRDLFLRFRV